MFYNDSMPIFGLFQTIFLRKWMENTNWNLSKPEYEKLLSFLGYGNVPEADIMVFGNEEGTGGYSEETNVKARCQEYGRDQKDNYINTIKCIKTTNHRLFDSNSEVNPV